MQFHFVFNQSPRFNWFCHFLFLRNIHFNLNLMREFINKLLNGIICDMLQRAASTTPTPCCLYLLQIFDFFILNEWLNDFLCFCLLPRVFFLSSFSSAFFLAFLVSCLSLTFVVCLQLWLIWMHFNPGAIATSFGCLLAFTTHWLYSLVAALQFARRQFSWFIVNVPSLLSSFSSSPPPPFSSTLSFYITVTTPVHLEQQVPTLKLLINRLFLHHATLTVRHSRHSWWASFVDFGSTPYLVRLLSWLSVDRLDHFCREKRGAGRWLPFFTFSFILFLLFPSCA